MCEMAAAHPGFVIRDSPSLADRAPDGIEDDLHGIDLKEHAYPVAKAAVGKNADRRGDAPHQGVSSFTPGRLSSALDVQFKNSTGGALIATSNAMCVRTD
jgi:hypothetical protein